MRQFEWQKLIGISVLVSSLFAVRVSSTPTALARGFDDENCGTITVTKNEFGFWGFDNCSITACDGTTNCCPV